jgi:hypothetical protein
MAVSTDTWVQAPYTDADYLSYVQPNVQTHPGNGVIANLVDANLTTRFSVARTARGYCTATPASGVFSQTANMRQAYGATEMNVGPYEFS